MFQNKHTKKPVKLKHATRTITDEEGLSRAYKSDKDVYVFGDTLYISGTKNAEVLLDLNPSHIAQNIKDNKFQDVIDDLKIPFGDTADTHRYKEAEAMLK